MERATYNPPDGYAATLPFKEGTIFLKESYRKKGIAKGAVFSHFVFYFIILSCSALLNLIALSILSPTYKKR
jgi:hypothetical protein